MDEEARKKLILDYNFSIFVSHFNYDTLKLFLLRDLKAFCLAMVRLLCT